MEVSKSAKDIAVTSKASKLQVSKVRELQDLNMSLNIGKLTQAGGLGSNPNWAEI